MDNEMFQIMRAEFHYCEIKPSSNIFSKHLHLCSKEKGQKNVIKKKTLIIEIVGRKSVWEKKSPQPN